jgi:uncharacterized protein (DUF1015 family)
VAILKPFKAIRPVRDKVHLVATRPFYSYKKNVLKAKLEDNPFTFLRIINPEFKSEVKTKPNSEERFKLVKDKYDEFINKGVLFQDENAQFYIYRQTKFDRVYTGIIGGASVEDYDNDIIKKHEATLTSREQMFTEYLDVVGYNAEPVLLSYKSSNEIKELISEIVNQRPEYEFTTTDEVKHELWLTTENDVKLIEEYFKRIPSIYIADGHHRSASSALLAKRRVQHLPESNKDFFLAYLIDEEDLTIFEFNRLVKSLNGLTKTQFLDKLSSFFEITSIKSAEKPKENHSMTVCIEGEWFIFKFKSEYIDYTNPVKSLDAEMLTNIVLKPILGIEDLKTDKTIEFISGIEPIEKMEEAIVKKKFQIGFVLYPATMDQVKEVADHNLTMPPKSTWVEPKLRSGLTIYNIND